MMIITRVFSTAVLIAISSFHLESISGTGTKVEEMSHKSNKHAIRVERNARRQHNIPMVLDPGAAAVENEMPKIAETTRKVMNESLSTTNLVKEESVSTTLNPSTKRETTRKVMNEALPTKNSVKEESVSTTLNPSTKRETSRKIINESFSTTKVNAESVSTSVNPSTKKISTKVIDEALSTTYLVKAEFVSTTPNPSMKMDSEEEEEADSQETESTKTTKSTEEGHELIAEIQKITVPPTLTKPNIGDASRNTIMKKEDITEKPDFKGQNETKIIPIKGEQIKICLGILSETNSCNYSVDKCENITNWFVEIVQKNNSNVFNIMIQIKSLWSDLAKKNNSCNDSNNMDSSVHITFTKQQKQRQTKQGKNKKFYKDANTNTNAVGDFDKLCLPAGQCIQFWFTSVEPSVSSCNIQITKSVVPEESMPDWVIALILYALYCTFYIAVWINCPLRTK